MLKLSHLKLCLSKSEAVKSRQGSGIHVSEKDQVLNFKNNSALSSLMGQDMGSEENLAQNCLTAKFTLYIICIFSVYSLMILPFRHVKLTIPVSQQRQGN